MLLIFNWQKLVNRKGWFARLTVQLYNFSMLFLFIGKFFAFSFMWILNARTYHDYFCHGKCRVSKEPEESSLRSWRQLNQLKHRSICSFSYFMNCLMYHKVKKQSNGINWIASCEHFFPTYVSFSLNLITHLWHQNITRPNYDKTRKQILVTVVHFIKNGNKEQSNIYNTCLMWIFKFEIVRKMFSEKAY